MNRIDPWGAGKYDYEKLQQFGIQDFKNEWKDLPNPPFFFRRGIVFGHRDFHRIKNAIKKREPWVILTGLMPSGKMHLGHKIVIDQVIYYQKIGADIHIAIADIEAYATRGYTLKEVEKIAIDEYVTNYIALGLKPCNIYFQSKNSDVKDMGYLLAKKANLSEVTSIYGFGGSTNMAHVFAPFIQAGDILHVQLDKYGGIRPTLVPVGVDQDPHIRFCRDISSAHRLYSVIEEDGRVGVFVKVDENIKELLDIVEEISKKHGYEYERNDAYKAMYIEDGVADEIDFELAMAERKMGHYGFLLPSSTYHRFITGLDGNKMSSSRPAYAIFLTDEIEEVKKKIWRAKTGGKVSIEEQRRYGGEPEKCMIYELFSYGLIEDDRELETIYEKCKQGEQTCGECKKLASELMETFLKDLKEKRENAKDKIKEYLSDSTTSN